ncbi:lung seven transmembrane receptor-domain-containing protein [Mycena olivaceomarginata]|nr:lung seven transmembrane receptor-domain-containing protein [Mycena olivaceomarginata]
MHLHLSFIPLLLSFSLLCLGYQVSVLEKDYSRQICSGMWANENTYINITFEDTSQGQLAMRVGFAYALNRVIYEWTDVNYLGKITSFTNDELPKTYVCTSDAMAGGFCTQAEMGKFILDLPIGKYLNSTSFWTARVELPANRTERSEAGGDVSGSSFWDNPAGNPTPPPNNYTSPWRRSLSSRADDLNPSPDGLYSYSNPFTTWSGKQGMPRIRVLCSSRTSSNGMLPATDYPKVNFMAVFGAAWGWLCYQHVQDLLPIQYYLSAYYRYLNAHGKSTASTVFLIVVAILDAGRNSMSFFMLLVSLGRTMLKCQILAGAHFIFGILYAVGIVELELESTSALVLLMFVIPLAFTLSGFLLWILYSLNATIAQLRARKQRYKLSMFENLYRILLFTVVVIAVFFVVSTLSFPVVSLKLAQDEEDAEDYDLESMGQRGRPDDDDDDAATLVGVRRGGHDPIGDEDDDDEEEAKKRRRRLWGTAA